MENSIKRNQIVKLEIEDLAFGGMGVAKVDNFVIFVESGLPGDIVEATIRRIKGNYAEAKINNMLTASPHRIAPVCEHFDYCGGCKWQNLEYAIQKKYKEDQVRSALIHLAGIADPPVEPIIGAHKIYYYRNKMEFSFHAGDKDETLLGLHVEGRFQDIFQLNKCHLQSELSNDIVKFVRSRSVELGLPPYHIVTHQGFLRFLVIREGKFTNQTLINFVTGRGDYPNLKILASEIAERFAPVVSISHTINSAKANIARGDEAILLHGIDHIHEILGERKYRISASSFFQTNSFQVQRLYDLAVELAQPEKFDKMLDLYAGTGTIAIYFAGMVEKVTGVESVAAAIEDAKINAKLNSAANCDFQAANVEDFLRDEALSNKKYDLAVLDPPRVGCHPDVIKSLLTLKPAKIVYISCNPATLARDLKMLLENDYSLDRVVPIDLFPHTYHIEAACRMSLKK